MAARKTFLYQRLYDSILDAITRGQYEQGQLLPSERELGESYQVDRTTVRRALQMLSDSGWVLKIPGKGTVVADGCKTASAAVQEDHAPLNIGFFLPQIKNVSDKITFPTYTSLLYIVEKACAERNMRLIYSALEKTRELDSYLSIGYDGIIFLSATAESHLQRARELGIPSVLLNNHDPKTMSVATNNFEGGKTVARHLIERGHRSFVVLAGNLHSRNCRERIEGFGSMLYEHEIELDTKAILGGDSWSFDSGYQHIVERFSRLSKEKLPTAIFACGDRLALGAIKALHDLGIKIPEDVSVIGYDNSEQALYSSPKLTSVDTNLDIMGSSAVRLLDECIQERSLLDHPVTVMIPPSLVEHESVATISL